MWRLMLVVGGGAVALAAGEVGHFAEGEDVAGVPERDAVGEGEGGWRRGFFSAMGAECGVGEVGGVEAVGAE